MQPPQSPATWYGHARDPTGAIHGVHLLILAFAPLLGYARCSYSYCQTNAWCYLALFAHVGVSLAAYRGLLMFLVLQRYAPTALGQASDPRQPLAR